jgi:hypothetical protein
MRRANAEVTEKLYIEILYPGSLVTETERKLVRMKEPEKHAKTLKPLAFGFRYVQVTEAKVLGEGKAVLKEKYRPGTFYIGKVLTLAEVKALKPPDRYEILVSNMECNKWDKVVQCRTGNFQSFEKNDKVITLKEKT